MKRQEYFYFLVRNDFNQAQIDLILGVRRQYEALEYGGDLIALDGWERDQWYTFNQSGLFEADDEENVSGITSWSQCDTRLFITEIVIENALDGISYRTLDEMRNTNKFR